MNYRIKQLLLNLFLVAAIFLTGIMSAACGGGEAKENNTGKPIIYTSFFPVYDIVSSLVGDALEVKSLMPIDKDPHLWEPSPKDLKKLLEADMLVVNGANLERWLDNVRNALPELPILVLSDSIELITYKGAAAMGDFQYLAKKSLKARRYSIEFGHTHEDVMRVCFFNNKEGLEGSKLINACKKFMEEKAELVPQQSNIEVVSGKVYGIEMGHESGLVYYTLPEDGDWVFVSDRISEPMLPYQLMDENGKALNEETLLEGSTSGFDKVTYDPHSWLSLANAKKYYNALNDALGEKYPEHKKSFQRNKLKHVDALTDLHYEYKSKFKDLRIREFVVTHNAYAYLSRDFDLRMFPLQALTSMESPSLKTIKKAIDFCRYYDIDTIFYEYGSQKKGADTLSEEIKGQAVPLVSMEYVGKAQHEVGEHYVDFMKYNLEKLYQALK